MSTVGGYLEYRGDTQDRGDIMMHVGGVQYRGGTQIIKDFSPTVLNTPMVLMIFPMCIMISAHSTEYPPRYS